VVERAAVIGGGTMGAGIAEALVTSGASVTIVDVDTATTIEDLPAGLDLIVEAVPEQLELKRAVLARCALREPLMLATNTSGLSIDELSAGLPAPECFLGLHFFNPVRAMKLVEIVVGSRTGHAARERALALCAQLGEDQHRRARCARLRLDAPRHRAPASERCAWSKTELRPGRHRPRDGTRLPPPDGAAEADRSGRPRRATGHRSQPAAAATATATRRRSS